MITILTTDRLIAAMDGVCLLFILAVLYGTVAETRLEKPKNRLFAASVGALSATLAIDCLSFLLNGFAVPRGALFLLNLLSVLLGQLLITAFAYYLVALVEEKERISRRYAHVVAGWCGLLCCVMLAASCTGRMFTIEDCRFAAGPWYSPLCSLSVPPMLYLMGLILSRRKVLGAHDTAAVLIYTALPILSTLVEAAVPELSITYVGVAPAAALLYVMLQSGEAAEARMRAELMEEVSCTDALTGLLNRRGFDHAMAEIAGAESCGVIFFDLNGLKEINDTKGHRAGDEMIHLFAELLLRHFRREEVFRISGDEFVALLSGLREPAFRRRVETVRREIACTDIAALGAVFGAGSEAEQLLREAEKSMYEDKKAYYERTGKDRRRL